MVSGIIGVFCGGFLSAKLKQKFERADPIICGISLTISSASLFFGVYLPIYSAIAALVLIFLGSTSLCFILSIADDMLFYVITPVRRGTAMAFRVLIAQSLVRAASTFIVGLVSKDFYRSLSYNMLSLYYY